MSLARDSDLPQSTSDSAPLFLLSPVALRPMTSHARIEGGALYTKGAELRPAPRKNFLPRLATKTGAANPSAGQAAATEKDTDSDTYRQKMWAGQANILVTVRLRPLLSHDRDREEIVKVSGSKEVVVRTRSHGGLMEPMLSANSPVRRHTIHPLRKPRHASASPSMSSGPTGTRSREKRYAFDNVFTPHDGQQKVYQHTTKFLIHGVLNGFNATVFAYGCTGAGKTYTMFGTPEEPGIMARTLEDLFRNIERVHADPAGRVRYRVTVSFLEVYNENIRDLLSASSSCSSASSMPTSEFLDLREDPVRGSVVAGLSEVEANNAKGVMKLLRRGNKYRSQESTAANSVSSRSHAVLQVHIEQQEKLTPGNSTPEYGDTGPLGDEKRSESTEVKFGKLSLVDLAGSERAAVTQNRGQRLLEGANINRSLLALGNCINALGEKGASASRSFVPYRDSKLTRLLKDSLGGNCRTVMIANVSLAASSVEETLNTLKYANRAKNIKTTVRRNIVEPEQPTLNQGSLVANLQEEIATLKKALLRQQEQANAGRHSPGESELRWVESQKFSGGKNSDNNNSEEEDWKSTKLGEARQYITETFQERRRLHHALLKLDYQIQHRVQELQTTQNAPALTSGPNNVQSPASPAKSASVVNQPPTQEKTNDASTTLTTTTSQTSNTPTEAAKTDITCRDQEFVSFAHEREGVMQRLAGNERAMDEFRRGIEQSPVMGRNELIREVLLMEYRIGDLEIDKMQLQTLRDLQMGVGPSLAGQHGNNDDMSMEPLDVRLVSKSVAGQELHLDVPVLVSDGSQPQTSDRDSGRVHLPEIKQNKATTGRGGFLEELREHLYPSKSNSHRDKQQEVTHTVAASPVTYHKHWGLHLNNASLPYIRLKKKNPVPLYVEPTTPGSLAEVLALGKSPSATSLAEPYLRSLKNRHKSRTRGKHSKIAQSLK
ncbi:Kinesin-like protein kif19 [Phytophthora pseudosyringae]|uniref:Kinesin-like protein n=1 Tax=Phytophthora pseudosyringae TaxID=221518 RepID=A0A8T1W6Z9_9STRA|nr:Kinesin-like protein kif19 [Phytophthora pseudosyringae]